MILISFFITVSESSFLDKPEKTNVFRLGVGHHWLFDLFCFKKICNSSFEMSGTNPRNVEEIPRHFYEIPRKFQEILTSV